MSSMGFLINKLIIQGPIVIYGYDSSTVQDYHDHAADYRFESHMQNERQPL